MGGLIDCFISNEIIKVRFTPACGFRRKGALHFPNWAFPWITRGNKYQFQRFAFKKKKKNVAVKVPCEVKGRNCKYAESQLRFASLFIRVIKILWWEKKPSLYNVPRVTSRIWIRVLCLNVKYLLILLAEWNNQLCILECLICS